MSHWEDITYKKPLPRTSWGLHVYPISEATLFKALDTFRITRVQFIFLTLRTSKSVLLSASYTGERIRQHPKYKDETAANKASFSHIHLHTVDPAERKTAEALLREQALPMLCAWLAESERQDENWRLNDHNLVFQFVKGGLIIEKDVKWKHCL